MSDAEIVSTWGDLQEIAEDEGVELIVIDPPDAEIMFRVRVNDGTPGGRICCYGSLEAVAAFFEGFAAGKRPH